MCGDDMRLVPSALRGSPWRSVSLARKELLEKKLIVQNQWIGWEKCISYSFEEHSPLSFQLRKSLNKACFLTCAVQTYFTGNGIHKSTLGISAFCQEKKKKMLARSQKMNEVGKKLRAGRYSAVEIPRGMALCHQTLRDFQFSLTFRQRSSLTDFCQLLLLSKYHGVQR